MPHAFPNAAERARRARLLSLLDDGLVLLHLDASVEGIDLPAHLLGNRCVALNLSRRFALEVFELGPLAIRASLSFSGVRHLCVVPWGAIYSMTRAQPAERWLFLDSAPTELVGDLIAMPGVIHLLDGDPPQSAAILEVRSTGEVVVTLPPDSPLVQQLKSGEPAGGESGAGGRLVLRPRAVSPVPVSEERSPDDAERVLAPSASPMTDSVVAPGAVPDPESTERSAADRQDLPENVVSLAGLFGARRSGSAPPAPARTREVAESSEPGNSAGADLGAGSGDGAGPKKSGSKESDSTERGDQKRGRPHLRLIE